MIQVRTLDPGELATFQITDTETLIVQLHEDVTPSQAAEMAEYLNGIGFPRGRMVIAPPHADILAEASDDQPEPVYAGRVRITWPAASSTGVLPIQGVTVEVADSGKQILAGFKLALVLGTDTGYEGDVIYADVTVLVDEDGGIITGAPVPTGAYQEHREYVRAQRPDGALTDETAEYLDALERGFTGPKWRTAVRRYEVAEMRIATAGPRPEVSTEVLDETVGVLEAFVNQVQSTDSYPTKDGCGDELTIDCLHHAITCVRQAAA